MKTRTGPGAGLFSSNSGPGWLARLVSWVARAVLTLFAAQRPPHDETRRVVSAFPNQRSSGRAASPGVARKRQGPPSYFMKSTTAALGLGCQASDCDGLADAAADSVEVTVEQFGGRELVA